MLGDPIFIHIPCFHALGYLVNQDWHQPENFTNKCMRHIFFSFRTQYPCPRLLFQNRNLSKTPILKSKLHQKKHHPWKLTWNNNKKKTNHPFAKENHHPKLHFCWGFKMQFFPSRSTVASLQEPQRLMPGKGLTKEDGGGSGSSRSGSTFGLQMRKM